MTAEILIAIALLCQAQYDQSTFIVKRGIQEHLKCQKSYIDCVKLKTEKVDQLGKALANCVKEK